MKKITWLLGLTLILNYGWSQINEKDTIITKVDGRNGSVTLEATILPDYINLQWTKEPDDFTGYFELYRSADGMAYNIVKQFQPKTFEGNDPYFFYRDEDPLRGKNYYRLIGYDKFTNEKRTIDLVAEYKNQPRRVLPTVLSNGNQLNITNYDGQELELWVYNSAATPLFKKLVSSSVIDVPSNLSKGLYVYQLYDRRRMIVSSGKFILQ